MICTSLHTLFHRYFFSFQDVLFLSTSFSLKMPSLKPGEYILHHFNKCLSKMIQTHTGRDERSRSKISQLSFFTSYVIEDGSPYMRSGKQNSSSTSGRGGRVESRDLVDDLGDDMWNFMSFCKKDFIKDSVPDQQLGLQELTVRYKGEYLTVNIN